MVYTKSGFYSLLCTLRVSCAKEPQDRKPEACEVPLKLDLGVASSPMVSSTAAHTSSSVICGLAAG